jgi:hypothetical protein
MALTLSFTFAIAMRLVFNRIDRINRVIKRLEAASRHFAGFGSLLAWP